MDITEAKRFAKALPGNLRRLAFAFRRDLEELALAVDPDAGVNPELDERARTSIVERYHDQVRSTMYTWKGVLGRAEAAGEDLPEDPDWTLAHQVLAVRDLKQAYALVTPMQEA